MPTSPRFSLNLSLMVVLVHHLNSSCLPLLKGRMAMWMLLSFEFLGLLFFLLLQSIATTVLIDTNLGLSIVRKPAPRFPIFIEAPAFRNGDECKKPGIDQVHIAMTLDSNYLRGTMAAVLSILQHTSCPENVVFHFLSANYGPNLSNTIKTTFPYLNFKVYRFESRRVKGRISKSIRQALDQPLNYARIYLSDIIQSNIARIIYLDSDVLVVNDIRKLWAVDLGDKVVAAPEYCHANFTKYFTDSFWFNSELSRTFHGRNPCYFNTGVMVLDVEKWRTGGYTSKVEYWMGVQKRTRIYHLGSLPPFLLVLAGNIKNIDHRWNQHGLGGDNIEGKCRKLHHGRVSLLHWSGKGKPWLRLDSRKPCVVDRLWAPYDLYRSSSSLEE